MWRRAEEIGLAEIDYNANVGTAEVDMQNSNSFVRALMEGSGINVYDHLPGWVDPEKNLPGLENDLSNPDSATVVEDVWDDLKARGENVPRTGQMGRAPGDAGRGTSGLDSSTEAAPPPSGGGRMGRVSQVDVPVDEHGPASADATPVAPLRADAAALLREAGTPLAPAREILLKDIRHWTEADTRAVMADPIYYRLDRPEHAPVQDRVRDWFQHHYGDRPHRNGFPPTSPEDFAIRPPSQPIAATTPDGQRLADALLSAATGLIKRAAGGPVAEPVKDLQAGLSLMDRGSGSTATAGLREDGVFGPKTKEKTAGLLAKAGSARVREAEAFGGLTRGLRKVATGGSETLADVSKRTLSPLYEKPKEPATTPKPWNAAIQRAVTRAGGGALKEDGVLGPKTERATWNALRKAGPEALAWTMVEETGLD
jgi:hypothetical protein